jgi:hypothetical protein
MPAATDSFYVGWCVEIVCKSGRRLSVTEDHMVLTGRGYCRASGVVQGDDVFASTDPERIAAFVDPDNNHCPAMIEEIFAASMMSSGMATSRVPVASEDFNGNARLLVSQVQVVDSESHLRDSADPGFMQLGSNSAFGGIQPCKSLNRFSPKELFPPRLDATTSCIMCGRDLPYPLPFVHSLPLNQFGGRLASRFNTDANESFTERTPRDARCFGKDICGFAGDVPIGKALHSGNVYAKRFDRQSVSLRRRSQANTQSLQHISASTSTDAKLAGKFLRRFARLVTPDKVVRVRRFKFADHVYDLECDPWRLLFCNGVIIHNCRCFLQPQVIVEEE